MNLSFTTIMTEVQRSFKRVREEEEDRASKLPRDDYDSDGSDLDDFDSDCEDTVCTGSKVVFVEDRYNEYIHVIIRHIFSEIETDVDFTKLVQSLNKITNKMSQEHA
jgi:hypothetical protein